MYRVPWKSRLFLSPGNWPIYTTPRPESTVDGRNPAPLEDGFPVNANKQRFAMVSKWCRISSIHRRTPQASEEVLLWLRRIASSSLEGPNSSRQATTKASTKKRWLRWAGKRMGHLQNWVVRKGAGSSVERTSPCPRHLAEHAWHWQMTRIN